MDKRELIIKMLFIIEQHPYEIGFCTAYKLSLLSNKSYNHSLMAIIQREERMLTDIPELKMFRPDENLIQIRNGFWFQLNQEGKGKRIDILNTILEELEEPQEVTL